MKEELLITYRVRRHRKLANRNGARVIIGEASDISKFLLHHNLKREGALDWYWCTKVDGSSKFYFGVYKFDTYQKNKTLLESMLKSYLNEKQTNLKHK